MQATSNRSSAAPIGDLLRRIEPFLLCKVPHIPTSNQPRAKPFALEATIHDDLWSAPSRYWPLLCLLDLRIGY